MGLLTVPKIGTNAAVNTFIPPLVNRYGYVCTPDLVAAGNCSPAGAQAGGGLVGFGSTFDRRQLLPRRRPGRLQPDAVTRWRMRHNIHAGYSSRSTPKT